MFFLQQMTNNDNNESTTTNNKLPCLPWPSLASVTVHCMQPSHQPFCSMHFMFCVPVDFVFVSVCLFSAHLRSLIACVLCCDNPDPLHPPEQDPLPSTASAAQLPFTSMRSTVERLRVTIPVLPVIHPITSARGPDRRDADGDGRSMCRLSCSTPSPSEGIDLQWLIPTRRQALSCLCPCKAACLSKMNLNTQ